MGTPTFGGGGGKRQKVRSVGLYWVRPTGESSVDEFERFSLDRKAVLTGIERAHAMGLKGDEMKDAIERLLRQYLPERERDAAQLAEDHRKDYLSRHFLCLLYSKSAEKQRWLLLQEARLFRHRFNALGADERGKLMCELRGAGWKGITQGEYDGLQARLMAVFGGRNMNLQENSYSSANAEYFRSVKAPWTHIHAVPFEDVIDLVRGRQVLLQGGCAYVLSRDLDAIAADSFKKHLTQKLAECSKAFQAIVHEEDERLGPLMLGIPDAHVAYASHAEGSVNLAELEAALEASAPLCMRSAFGVLQATHHLKHHARLQFGLFLKGIGVRMEDALAFWRAEFAKGGTTGEEFEKRYTYNFRHQYGQAGARKNYSPYGCAKVIGASPDTSGATGCPFRNCKAAGLEKALGGMGLQGGVVTAAVGKAKEGHFQVACTMVYEARHGKMHAELGVQHPNQYFAESRKAKEEKEGDGGFITVKI
jgi:DNA primase large subunit